MAKFIKLTYGSNGDTKAYTYIVNDNVRSGDILHPVVKHYKSQKLFVTTGIVQNAYRTTSAMGKDLKNETLFAMLEGAQKQKAEPLPEITKAYTNKELNLGRAINKTTGKFIKSGGAELGGTEKVNGIFVGKKHNQPITSQQYDSRVLNLLATQRNLSKAGADYDISTGEQTQEAMKHIKSASERGGIIPD